MNPYEAARSTDDVQAIYADLVARAQLEAEDVACVYYTDDQAVFVLVDGTVQQLQI